VRLTIFYNKKNKNLCQGINGSRVQKVLESVHIGANKNTVPRDVSAMVHGGIRMGIRSRQPTELWILLGYLSIMYLIWYKNY